MTFAARRTQIVSPVEIQKILADDSYREVKQRDARPGDIVLYCHENGDANHSGLVVRNDAEDVMPTICSKWGKSGEFIHGLYDVPALYGPGVKFYRCEP